ncbi:MAG TPA: multicopper oxidase family protein [Alphaproteobacteria bacterium]
MISEKMSRRTLLRAGAGAAALAAAGPLARRVALAGEDTPRRLVAAPGRWALVGPGHPQTEVWTYGGTVPGPIVRAKQGARLSIQVENRLAQPTTVHWHGIRLPNAMDGVPDMTQKPIAPGESFLYSFDLPDAGTYWYHPHFRSAEQVGRGLAGALIVEEAAPPAVDRDLVWLIDDWRLTRDAEIAGGFNDLHDMTHNGRIGNTVTVNGRVPETFAVRAGERLRLRLINAANARIFGLEFTGHRPVVLALDGQPVEPHEPEGGRVVLGPAMRADVILDMTGRPGERFAVNDMFYRGMEYKLLDIVYGPEAPLRERPPDPVTRLAGNTMPEPDLAGARRHDVVFTGGMMGGMAGAMMGGRHMDVRELMRHGMAWAINGVAAGGHDLAPALTLERGRTHVLAMNNETAWHHPIHLHGHAFRVIARNGRPTRYREWQDTVLVAPRERVDVAFVADNPGDWMFHCHILEHQEGGMMSVFRVA